MNKQLKPNTDEYIFSEETVMALVELGHVLRSILKRLIQDGEVKIVNGKVVFIEKNIRKK